MTSSTVKQKKFASSELQNQNLLSLDEIASTHARIDNKKLP